jgi:16S rRNA (guanine1516-N2)-methyltransferase
MAGVFLPTIMSLSIIVTTSVSELPKTVSQAMIYAKELGAPYTQRKKLGITSILLKSNAEAALIVRSDSLTLSDGEIEYTQHPNMMLVRGFNVIKNMRDLYLEAAQLSPGESVLDCTAGFCCEAGLAAFAVGETGVVDALESEPALALVTRHGLAHCHIETNVLREAIQRVNLINADYSEYLAAPNAPRYDVIYFDPFFDHRLHGSEANISPLARFGNLKPLDENAVLNALKLARRLVIVKHPDHIELSSRLVEKRIRLISSRKGKVSYSVLKNE